MTARAPLWSEAELRFLERNYKRMAPTSVTRRLNAKFHGGQCVRSMAAVYVRAHLIGAARRYVTEKSFSRVSGAELMRVAAGAFR